MNSMVQHTNSRTDSSLLRKDLNASTLIIIAVVTMLIDHVAYVLQIYSYSYSTYHIMRVVGRIAFPIFAFMIAEGAKHTRDIRKYLLRLLIFAFISEVPFDLAFDGKIDLLTGWNVCFTLFFGLLSIACYRQLKEITKWYLPCSIVFLIACMYLAYYQRTDYAETGVLLIFVFYVLSNQKNYIKIPGYITAVILLCFYPDSGFNTSQLFGLMALPLILSYNGEKGKQLNKYVFYGFYPGHLLLLYFINILMFWNK